MNLNISIRNFSFDNKTIFREQNINIEGENIIAIVGENGVGKSTLVNLITGNIESNIELEFNGKILIPGYNENIVFIPDDFIGFEYLTPLEVCRYFTLLYGECFDQVKFNNIIEIANLEKTIAFKEFIKNLSKGTKQKVSFLIYMMINRDIIIFDEGLENIDEKSLTNILNYLNKWVKTNKKLCLIATHSKIILNHIEKYIYLTKINDSDGTLILKSEDSKFNKNHLE